MSEINLVYKVNGIITERDELITLILNYVMENGLEESFHKHLLAADKSDEYRMLDLKFMALDYMGYENENQTNTTKGDN